MGVIGVRKCCSCNIPRFIFLALVHFSLLLEIVMWLEGVVVMCAQGSTGAVSTSAFQVLGKSSGISPSPMQASKER